MGQCTGVCMGNTSTTNIMNVVAEVCDAELDEEQPILYLHLPHAKMIQHITDPYGNNVQVCEESEPSPTFKKVTLKSEESVEVQQTTTNPKLSLRLLNNRIEYENGDVYEGDWSEGKANGIGVYYYANGNVRYTLCKSGKRYEGQWLNDLYHGNGVESFLDGSEYKGEYILGKKHGQGTMLFADGSIYKGDFEDDEANGLGIFHWGDGRYYQGLWLHNQMHGKGTCHLGKGRRYEGNYRMGLKHGFGQYTWADGKVYKGQWRLGLQHGKGLLILPSGDVKSGVWVEGRMIIQPIDK